MRDMITRPHARASYPDSRCVNVKMDKNGAPGRWARTLCFFVAMLVAGGTVMGASLLGGTVLSIDREARQLTLQMPEGHPSLFPATTEDLLKDVKVGDRVSIELDRDGKITKLIKLPIDQGN